MDNVIEALYLAQQFKRARLYDKAIQCNALAVHFLNKLKTLALPSRVLHMCDEKIAECIDDNQRIEKMKQKIVLKKYVLLNDNIKWLQ
jgi:hypothetical protein